MDDYTGAANALGVSVVGAVALGLLVSSLATWI